MYYNTTNQKGTTLKDSVSKTEKQEVKVLRFFKENPKAYLSPCQVHKMLGINCPITSIRRTITDLTGLGELEKTDIMHEGVYGKKVHTWKLKIIEIEEDGQSAIKF